MTDHTARVRVAIVDDEPPARGRMRTAEHEARWPPTDDAYTGVQVHTLLSLVPALLKQLRQVTGRDLSMKPQ